MPPSRPGLCRAEILSAQVNGVTLLVIEHQMRVVMNLCDRVAVLDYGEKIADATPKEIQINPAVSSTSGRGKSS